MSEITREPAAAGSPILRISVRLTSLLIDIPKLTIAGMLYTLDDVLSARYVLDPGEVAIIPGCHDPSIITTACCAMEAWIGGDVAPCLGESVAAS